MALYQSEVQEFVVNASSSDKVEPEEKAVVDEKEVLDHMEEDSVSFATVFWSKLNKGEMKKMMMWQKL